MTRQLLASLSLAIGLFTLCVAPGAVRAAADEPALIPWPKSIKVGAEKMTIPQGARISVNNDKLVPLGELFADELFMLSGRRFDVVNEAAIAGDLVLELAPSLKELAQHVEITADRATAQGGTYTAVAMASTTLLQAITSEAGTMTLPQMVIDDEPGSVYCGTMLDVARQWHPAEALKPVIELCRLYKIQYLHLHLTDNQLFTFPSTAFPKLASDQHYTLDELKDLVAYADARGVTLIPEIEMPGHTRMDSAMPELFGAPDAEGKPGPLGVLNIANEEIYPALDTLIGEVCDVFASSPYFHMGGDETNFSAFNANPSVAAYKKKTGKNTQQLFADFINHINAIAKKHGKKTLIWEGFGEGSKVDKDITVLAWHGSSHAPKALINEGYNIINVPWIPSVYSTVRENYEWNIWRLNLSEAGNSVQLDPTPKVLGGQMVLWEKGPTEAVPMLRLKAPARQERVYAPHQKRTYEDFAARLARTDALLDRLLYPVQLQASGLIQPDELNFGSAAKVAMSTQMAGVTIHYEVNGGPPTFDSPVYQTPLTITAEQAVQVYLQAFYGKQVTISARAFNAAGEPVGQPSFLALRHDAPRFKYALYHAPGDQSFKQMPDFAKLKSFEEGVLGRINSASNIKRGDGSLAMVATATFESEGDGEYAFSLKATPAARLLIDNKLVCEVKNDAKHAEGKINLTKGSHALVIQYFTNEGKVQIEANIEKFPVRTKHHWEDRGLYEWLTPLKTP
jgi:hexosaminidase